MVPGIFPHVFAVRGAGKNKLQDAAVCHKNLERSRAFEQLYQQFKWVAMVDLRVTLSAIGKANGSHWVFEGNRERPYSLKTTRKTLN